MRCTYRKQAIAACRAATHREALLAFGDHCASQVTALLMLIVRNRLEGNRWQVLAIFRNANNVSCALAHGIPRRSRYIAIPVMERPWPCYALPTLISVSC